MEMARFRWRRLAAAIGIGFGIEVLEVIFVVRLLPRRRADAVGNLPLSRLPTLSHGWRGSSLAVLTGKSATCCLWWRFSG